MTGKLLYTGTSMNPLFREGDILELAPYQEQDICVGDVVAFPHPDKAGKVIHRVVAVGPRGILTQGDNLPTPDDWTITPGDILGQVVAIRRQGRTLPVPRQAPVTLSILRMRQWCDRVLSRLLHPVYRRLARSGWVRGLLGAFVTPRLIQVSRAEGPEWQLWLGRLLIGRKLPQVPYWTIRRPFRLLVDEASLPPGGADSPDPRP